MSKKLTRKDKMHIAALSKRGASTPMLMELYGCSREKIHKILADADALAGKK